MVYKWTFRRPFDRFVWSCFFCVFVVKITSTLNVFFLSNHKSFFLLILKPVTNFRSADQLFKSRSFGLICLISPLFFAVLLLSHIKQVENHSNHSNQYKNFSKTINCFEIRHFRLYTETKKKYVFRWTSWFVYMSKSDATHKRKWNPIIASTHTAHQSNDDDIWWLFI